MLTGWFSMNDSLLSLAYSKSVYVIAVPRLASTSTINLSNILCLIAADLKKNYRTRLWSKQKKKRSSTKKLPQVKLGSWATMYTHIVLLKKASIDMTGAVCGYVSGQETSIRKALGSPFSPIWRGKNIIRKQ